MGWFDWLCCRKSVSPLEEEEEVICPTASSPSTSDSTTAVADSEMGKVVSKVKTFFCPETSIIAQPPQDRNDGSASRTSYREDSVNVPLASPRSPLIRGIGTLTPPDTPVLPSSKRLKEDCGLYLNFTISTEKATIDYIQRNKVMVIMKGLSGSGKTTLSEHVNKVYDGSIICSADHFFMIDGEYKFEPQKLKDAHGACQEKARQAARRNNHVIIIDNTNVRNWESQVYLQMCKEYHYVAIYLQPQTPWCFDPSELVRRSTHDLEEEFLAKKLKTYQQALPIYYAWFLNEPDSRMISKRAWQWLERALLEIEEFCQDFSQFSELDSIEDMLEYFINDNVIHHITAKYANRGKASGALEYVKDPEVTRALGRCYPITVIGYVITPRTFGARIRLREEQLELWGQDDQETPPDNYMHGEGFHNKNETQNPKESKESMDTLEDDDVVEVIDLCEPRITITPQELDRNRLCPTSGKGSRAHITLGSAYGVKPVTTGFDMIDIVSCEQKLKKERNNTKDDNKMDVDSPLQDNKSSTYNIEGAVIKSYGKGRWVIYPDTKAVSESLFAGFY